MNHFLEQCFFHFFLVAVIWNVIFFGYFYYKRRQRYPLFPDEAEVTILHKENMASGRSHKSIFTKFGGAQNCLKIIVTNDELWVTSWFPFLLLVDKIDLEHRIPKTSILKVDEKKKFWRTVFEISFNSGDKNEMIEIIPKYKEQFREAISS